MDMWIWMYGFHLSTVWGPSTYVRFACLRSIHPCFFYHMQEPWSLCSSTNTSNMELYHVRNMLDKRVRHMCVFLRTCHISACVSMLVWPCPCNIVWIYGSACQAYFWYAAIEDILVWFNCLKSRPWRDEGLGEGSYICWLMKWIQTCD